MIFCKRDILMWLKKYRKFNILNNSLKELNKMSELHEITFIGSIQQRLEDGTVGQKVYTEEVDLATLLKLAELGARTKNGNNFAGIRNRTGLGLSELLPGDTPEQDTQTYLDELAREQDFIEKLQSGTLTFGMGTIATAFEKAIHTIICGKAKEANKTVPSRIADSLAIYEKIKELHPTAAAQIEKDANAMVKLTSNNNKEDISDIF
jgi:hypothetical protein